MEYIVNVSAMEVADVSKEIIAFLAHVRLSRGLTYPATSRLVNGAANMVYRAEHRSATITIGTLFELCNLYSLTLIIKTPNTTFAKIIKTQGDDRLIELGAFIRRNRGVSRVQLSQDAGVGYYTLANAEDGSTAIKLINFLRIAKALDWQIKITETIVTQ